MRDYAAFTEAAHAKGALVTAVADLLSLAPATYAANCKVAVAADILSLALLTPPGEWGADIVVGTTSVWVFRWASAARAPAT